MVRGGPRTLRNAAWQAWQWWLILGHPALGGLRAGLIEGLGVDIQRDPQISGRVHRLHPLAQGFL